MHTRTETAANFLINSKFVRSNLRSNLQIQEQFGTITQLIEFHFYQSPCGGTADVVTDEEDERYFGEWKDEEEDDCAEFAAANILEGFKGLARRIDSLDELQDGEYGVLLKTGQDDFHFVKYFPKSKTFFHKPGGTRIRRMSRAEALGDKWYGTCNTYCSKTIFFAVKER